MRYVVKFHWRSGICYLIFIGSLTVRIDLSDYKLVIIGQVKSDSFGVTIAKIKL